VLLLGEIGCVVVDVGVGDVDVKDVEDAGCSSDDPSNIEDVDDEEEGCPRMLENKMDEFKKLCNCECGC